MPPSPSRRSTTRAFVGLIGKLGEDVVLELRQRLFAHFQRLPVAFHEHYTSGRVISRQVSDVDSISDLFEDGLDSLVSAVFSLLLVGVGMLLLDWPLALVVLAGFGPLAVAYLVVPARVGDRLPAQPGNDRTGHRGFCGDLHRHPRRPGVPP